MANIRILLVLVVVTVAVESRQIPDSHKEMFLNIKKECMAETSVDPGLIEKLYNDRVFTEGDAAFDKFFECKMKKLTVMKDDGTVSFELLKENLPDDVDKPTVFAAIDECGKFPSGPTLARLVAECLAKVNDAHIGATL